MKVFTLKINGHSWGCFIAAEKDDDLEFFLLKGTVFEPVENSLGMVMGHHYQDEQKKFATVIIVENINNSYLPSLKESLLKNGWRITGEKLTR